MNDARLTILQPRLMGLTAAMEQHNAGWESVQGFPNDPHVEVANNIEAPRELNSAALMEALAALETEFRKILNRHASSTD